MDTNRPSRDRFIDPRVFLAFAFCSAGIFLATLSLADTSPSGSWSIVPSPNVNAASSNELAAVTCVSSQDCWAVGHYLDPNNRKQTLIEHWDGTSWSIVPSPNPSSDSALTGVACASGSECWAVGFQSNGGALQTLIQRWNGTSWSVVPSANKTTQDNRLDGITCDSAGRCWAVGSYTYPTENPSDMLVFKPTALGTLIQRWNGTAWEIVASPNDEVDRARCAPFKCTPLDNTLVSVTCTSASDCWAVGTVGIGQLILRWNGTSWSIVTPTFEDVNFGELRVEPQSITCPSPSDCRVVGAYYADYESDASPRGFIEHWNGRKWALVQKPDPGKSNALAGVTCASPSDCWAAGSFDPGSAVQTLIQRWDGSSWSTFSSPNAGGATRTNKLNAVTCTSGTECWAVGFSGEPGSTQTLIQRYAPGALASAQLQNISTRLRVQTGDNVLIGGFIVTGDAPKRVILRAIGPSLSTNGSGVPGRLVDPTLELVDNAGAPIAANDNWKDSPQRAEIEASGIAPADDREAAIARTLAPGNYTATVRGAGGATGIGLVEAYDIDSAAAARLANISTRGFVETGDNVMIGGFIIGPADGTNSTIVIRAIGPSLTSRGVAGALADPTVELNDANGTVIAANDNWKDAQQAEIAATGIAPTDDRESAILQALSPGNYTAVVRGRNDSTGVTLVEAYNLGSP